MEILARLRLDLLLGLPLKLDQLCPLEVAGHLVVLPGEHLALMRVQLVSLCLAFELSPELVDLCLLQLGNKVVGLHCEVWIVVACEGLEPWVDTFLALGREDLHELPAVLAVDADLNSFILIVPLLLYYLFLGDLLDLRSLGLLVVTAFLLLLGLPLFENELIGHIFELLLDLK